MLFEILALILIDDEFQVKYQKPLGGSGKIRACSGFCKNRVAILLPHPIYRCKMCVL
jgi:hypothetical protein